MVVSDPRTCARASAQQGFALPAAIGALMIVGMLVTAGIYVARQELRIGIAEQHSHLAFYAAERAAQDYIADWNGATMTSLAVMGTNTKVDSTVDAVTTVKATKLSSRIFFVDSQSRVMRGGPLMSGGQYRLGMTVRLLSAPLAPPAALTTRGTTELKGSAEVHGEDGTPAGWGGVCTNPPSNKPGILLPPGSTATGGTITGNPAVRNDATIADSTFTKFGDLTWAALVAMADKDITSLGSNINGTAPDSTATGVCKTGTPTNWGNPEKPGAACGGYFPIIYHNGPTLRIQSGGTGQGVLLVNGTLDLRGGFVFYGIIIVQGTIETQGSGNRIYGGVLASNADFDAQSLVGGSVVSNSTCAVERAVLNNSSLTRARPFAERSWVDLNRIGS